MQVAGYSLLALGFASGILVLAAREQQGQCTWFERLLSITPLRLIGRYSYAMYVFHLPLVIALTPVLRRALPSLGVALAPVVALLVGIASFIAAAISYQLFEKHVLALKERLAPRADAQRS
jgi:peptidoglycan/LPS O-acetylase OafA/YrhL